ncbi:MAG: DUF2586 domain-containing protein [Victivallaceae bacterium]|nr:DUF2586 domain-containing protein [Victivallaceae bacterium]
MATGKVTVVQVNNNQGNFDQVERVFLYLGTIADAEALHQVIPVSAESDLDALLGAGDCELKTQIAAARENSRDPDFACYAVGVDFAVDDWKEILYAVLEKPHDLNVEAAVLCHPVASKLEVEAVQTAAVECLTRFAKFITIHAAVAGIDAETQSWGEYDAAVNALIADVAADRVALAPLLHGNDLGVVCGRLCDPAASIADSPMRVATGALIGLGEAPVDKNDNPLNSTMVAALSTARFSVAQWYTGYAGMYWADHMMLDAEGGDFQVYEYRRIMDYLARRVRILAIGRIADRRLNSTAQSISANETYFARPLREASLPVQVAGVEMPAMISPPATGAIRIVWSGMTAVSVAITAKPYNCPKSITLYLGLDLS